jgi:hypothetical protein
MELSLRLSRSFLLKVTGGVLRTIVVTMNIFLAAILPSVSFAIIRSAAWLHV